MRIPADRPRHFPGATRRSRIVIAVVVVVLVALIASLRGLAGLYIDYLWFDSTGFTSVFRGVLLTKVLLSVIFVVLLALMIFASLTIADRLALRDSERTYGELSRRFREITRGHTLWIRIVLAVLFGLLGGIGADREWNNWDLLRYQVSFGQTDPQFHKDIGFYVFELPFIRFLVSWAFEAVFVVLLLTAVYHYVTGGINVQTRGQRVRPAVKAHLSVLLGLLAIIKAVAYYYDRYALVLARNHVVDGATATDVHATLPAKLLLMIIAIIAAVLFLANIRQRGWMLPAVGVALWALVSILVGTVYPAVYQALRVNPSELTRETTYIQRNIDATRSAFGLDKVQTVSSYNYNPTVTTPEIQGSTPQAQVNQQTIANIRMLDPAVNLTNTFDKYQALRTYYAFDKLNVDRYDLNVDGSVKETATVSAVRQLNDQVPSGFVNQKLTYTHGYGAVVAPISQAGINTTDGTPDFALSGLPPSGPAPVNLKAEGSKIYYGDDSPTNGYVIADSKTPETDYENTSNQTTVTSHYAGKGGVDAGSIVRRAAFALDFWDANFLLSGQITPTSKVMFYRNVTQRAEKAAPFLKFDSDPYSVILNGNVYWVLDAYTTTNNYPYSQEANTQGLPPNSGLNKPFNYARNSVKVVISAYSGQMDFFDMGTKDPILKAYERAFPDLFKPASEANQLIPGITAHWRYPEDLFQIQTNMYGRYHLTKAADFYSQAQSWAVSPDPGSGQLTNETAIGSTGNSTVNNQLSASVPRLAPQYILAGQPDSTQQGVDFELITPFVPISGAGSSNNLTAFMTASSDPGSYGDLTVYQLPAGETVDGPGLVSNAIRSNTQISQELTLWNQPSGGTLVELGEVSIVPIDSTLLYVEPVYVESNAAKIPTLDDVIVVYNGKAYHSSNASIDNALCQIVNPDGSKPFSSYCNTAAAQSQTQQTVVSNGSGSSGKTPITLPGATNKTTPTTVPAPPATSGGHSPATTVPVPPAGATVQSLVAQANTDLSNANSALASGNLGAYQAWVAKARTAVAQANQLAGKGGSSKSPPSSSKPPAGRT